jgi:hypothetical protein
MGSTAKDLGLAHGSFLPVQLLAAKHEALIHIPLVPGQSIDRTESDDFSHDHTTTS